MKFYFAGSIKGGRDLLPIYKLMSELLGQYGEVLDKHVASNNVFEMEKDLSPEFIYQRDVDWIKESDILVGEVSIPSLGVGYEISYASNLGKKIVCFCKNDIKLSSMVSGDPNVSVIKYSDEQDLLDKLKNWLDNNTKKIKVSHVLEAFFHLSLDNDVFLNIYTGEVISINYYYIDEEYKEELLDKIESGDYIKIPSQHELRTYQMMLDYSLSLEDETMKDKLLIALRGKGAFRRFKDSVLELGIREDWFKFEKSELKKKAISFIEDKGYYPIDDVLD